MKRDFLTFRSISVILIFLTFLTVGCTSVDNKTPDTEKPGNHTDTAYLVQAVTGTSELAQAVGAVEDIETTSSTKPLEDNKPIATKPSPTKQPIAVEKPAVVVPITETPEIAPAVTQPTPNVEPTPELPPLSASPILQQADLNLKSTKAFIKGSSSLHAWESNITQIQGKGTFEIKDDKLIALKDVEIKIAVTGIKSKEGKRMDNKTYETFKSDQHPVIIYKFGNAVVLVNDSNDVTVEAPGQLTMAGITKSVPIKATGKILPNGDLQLSFSKKLKMTDFNMEPPVMMLGTIKVGDEVLVEFDFVLERIK